MIASRLKNQRAFHSEHSRFTPVQDSSVSSLYLFSEPGIGLNLAATQPRPIGGRKSLAAHRTLLRAVILLRAGTLSSEREAT
jgi:hypothetical protein